MDSHQLALFLSVLDSPSMKNAAETLHLSSSAVSLQLRALAEELGTDLFIRSGRKLKPTPAAHRLEPHARRIVEELHAIAAEFEGSAEQDSQPFRLATGVTTLLYALGAPLRAMRTQYPHVDLRVSILPTEAIVAGLLDRQIDLGIISLPYECPNLKIIPLFEEELLLVCPASSRSTGAVAGTVHAKTLDGQPCLLYPPHSNMRNLIDKFFSDLKIEPRVIMEAEDTEVIKRMVEEGFGFSILPESALYKWPGRFEILRLIEGRITRQQALAICKIGHTRALTSALATFLRSNLKSNRQTA